MFFFLYGPDTFRAKQKIKQLKDKFIAEVDPEGTSIVELDGAKLKLEELFDAYVENEKINLEESDDYAYCV